MQIVITLSTGTDSAERIAAVLAAVNGVSAPVAVPESSKKAAPVKKLDPAPVVDPKEETTTGVGGTKEEEEPENTTKVKEISDEDLRAVAIPLKDAGKAEAVKAAIQATGAKSLTAIPQDQRSDFLAALKAIQ